jgi:hypothetical protein
LGLATAVTAAPAAATIATATTPRAFAGFVDPQGAAAEVLAVECLNGLVGVSIAHFDEAEAARATRVAVLRQGDIEHFAVSRE